MLSKLKYIVLSVLLVLATYNITKTTLEVYKNSRRLDELKSEAEAKREENKELKKELSFKETSEFIEQEARNKLNLVKPGEKVLITNGDVKGSSVEDVGVGSSLELGTGAQTDIYMSNAQKWFKLFFDNK